jgi:hypothetical protein
MSSKLHNGTATSIAAAKQADEATTQRNEVLQKLVFAGPHGMTRDELCAALYMGPPTICPRVSELVKSGDVIETGRRRKTRKGRDAFVLVWHGVWNKERDGERPARKPSAKDREIRALRYQVEQLQNLVSRLRWEQQAAEQRDAMKAPKLDQPDMFDAEQRELLP